MGSDLQGNMDLRLWFLCFLPVSGSLKVLPEVQLEAERGGSIIIKCPLPLKYPRIYLCRQMINPRICSTVVSNNFVKEEYKRRVTLKPRLNEKLFLVKMIELTEDDSGIYACGVGPFTDRGKTQKITLNVHDEYEPFWEDEPTTSEPLTWFHKVLHHPIPSWLHMAERVDSSEFTSKVTTPAPRPEATSVPQPSSTTPVTRHPRVSKASLITAAEFPALPPATTAPKTSPQEAVGPFEAIYSHHTRPHRQSTFHDGPQYGRQDRGFHISTPQFHILIPTFLGFLLLVLLGVIGKRVIQRRKAFSRRVGRLAMRMRGRQETSRPFPARRLGVPQRPRSQNNIYSACPRRAAGPDSVGSPEAPLFNTPASASPSQPQVLEAPWSHAPSLKRSCEYVTLGHQSAVNEEDADSDDYVNIPGPPYLPDYTPGPRHLCQ